MQQTLLALQEIIVFDTTLLYIHAKNILSPLLSYYRWNILLNISETFTTL